MGSALRTALSSMSLADLYSAPEPSSELKQTLGAAGFQDLSKSIELLKNRKQISLFREHIEQVAPEVMKVMLDQRDRIMVEKLFDECQPGCTVAVVGMAHMDGIEQQWQQRGGEVFLHHDNSLRK